MSPRRLAQTAIAHPRRMLAIWAGIVLVAFGLTGALLDRALITEGDVTSNAESKRAGDLIDERLPDRDPVDEIVVVRSERIATEAPAFRARVSSLATELRASGVEQLSTYLEPGGAALVSADGQATMIPVVLAGGDEDKHDNIDGVLDAVATADGVGGFAVDVTGEHTVSKDFERLSEEDLREGELRFGLPAAMVVLLLVFGTLVGAGIPLAMALISIVVGLGVVALIGLAFDLNIFIVNMLIAMGLALGIDYSLFIVSRLREELRRGVPQGEAILNVASTATRAVVFSGTAFAFALLGMFLVPDMTLRSLALGAIVVASVSVAVALTFHPALLMVLGHRVNRLRVPWLGRRVAASAGREGRFWGRAVRGVMRRPALSLVVSVALLLAAASPLLGMKLGAAGPETLPGDTVGKQGLIALERDFPTGATTPVDIVLDTDGAPPLQPRLAALRRELDGDPDFAVAGAGLERGEGIVVAAVPLNVEASTEDATRAIDRLRDEYVPAAFGEEADRVQVGGWPAEGRDYFALIGEWLPIVIAFVLTLSFALLTLAFRSIVVPLTAIAVNLLSVGAAYGLLVLVFQEGVGAGLLGFQEVERIDAWVPVFMFSVLFGLSMDYQVFLLSRIREHYSGGGDTTAAIVFGVGSTARLITGAALIIIVVFAGFAAGQLVPFQQMGFGVAVALAVDATIVRLVVIPAAMRLLGERNWYLPQWLGWLPRVEIEDPQARGEAGRP